MRLTHGHGTSVVQLSWLTTATYLVLCHILPLQLVEIYLITTLPVLLVEFLGARQIVVVESCYLTIFE